MCGICGIIDYTINSHIEEDTIRRMSAQMQHRGPDDEGVYIIKNGRLSVGLGHRRLSIIDLSSAAHQPMSNEDGSLWLVLNGEIYNYQVLRKDLKDRGHRFRSNTDAEVVLHLYEYFAESCVSYLRGMFAFAIWDDKEKKLMLARDRVGKKPLFYININGKFCFASELLPLVESDFVKKEINFESLHYYLSFGYIPAPFTIYKNIFKLLPAHVLILKDGKVKTQCYWALNYNKKLKISLPEAEEELIRHIEKAVKIRLYSDVPIGAFLSGGIDSSTVVALMSKLHNAKVKTFSIGFDEEDYNELKHARRVAKLFNTDHHEFIVKPDALEVLPELVKHYGEPYADSSAIPTYYVSKKTREFVTVALNGDGGDESFAGYERYQAMYLAQMYNKLPNLLRDSITYILLKFLPDSINPKNKYRRLRRFLENASKPFYPRYLRWVCMLSETEKHKIYNDNFSKIVQQYDPSWWLRDYPNLTANMQLLDQLLLTDIKTNLANDLCVKMDIASMANSLETRSPLLDQELMEFSASLPSNFKMRRFNKKYIFKRVVSRLIPAANIYRKKMGFGVPIGHWMRNELKNYVKGVLLSKKALSRGYFNQEALKEYVLEHTEAKKDHTFGLWTLLMLELWQRRFIDNERL
jgi:asparagine synthase (glutamine-hydrolysing)